MKILLWGATLLLAVIWTVGIALLASVANWLAGAGDEVVGAVKMVAEWPVPPWASVWLDPALLDSVRAALTWSIDALATYAPWLFDMVGWLAPVLWVLWGLGMFLLLVAAVVGQVLLGRTQRSAERR